MAQTDDGKTYLQKRWLVVSAIALLALIFLIPFFKDGGARVDTSIEVETQAAVIGDIRETTTGTGRVVGLEHWDLAAPYDGLLAQCCVQEGDTVKAGDVIAVYDAPSLDQAVEDTLSRIEALDEEIQYLGEQTDFTLTAEAGGLVKEVNAQRGTDTADTLLVLLSTDGFLQVRFACGQQEDAPGKGEIVTVSSGGNRTEGEVEQWEEDDVTIVFPDGLKWTVGAEAEVKDRRGRVLGTGTIAAHAPLEVRTERTGIVTQVLCSVGDEVEQDEGLLTAVDVGLEDDCEALTRQRRAAAEELLALRTFRDKPEVVSEYDGIISDVEAKAGDNVTRDAALCRIVSQNRYLLSITIPNREADRVREGQKVELRFGESVCTGEVTGAVADEDRNAITCPITARLEDNCGHQVGDEAQAQVVLAERTGVVLVPLQGLSVAEDGSETVNVAYGDGLTHARPVVTGLRDGKSVEIMKGVDEGEQIVISSRLVETTFYSLFNHEWVVDQKEGPAEEGLLTEEQEPVTESVNEN